MDHSPRFLRLVEEVRPRIQEITIEDYLDQVAAGRRPLLLDVREDHEWAAGHIPTARHLGKGILERDIEKLVPDLDADLVLYCGGGFRSALATDALLRMGYRRVTSLAGGFRAWRDAGRRIEVPGSAPGTPT